MDDRCFDSPTQPKRPRVFFTEDQKDVLRQAYAQDPYPNQSTIENLAKSLNVGVKTVINWFHNHRMRAKQQHHSGNGTTTGSNDNSVKSEQDEGSNHSDISSVSGDVGSNSVPVPPNPFFPGGVPPADLNQWMFPQFEAVPLLHKGSSSHDEDDDVEDNKENMTDEVDEADGMESGSADDAMGSSHNNNNNETKDKDMGDNSEGENSGVSVEGKNSGPVGVAGSVESRVTAAPSTTSSTNKRKRSNPQRVYEGAQLDRTANAQRIKLDHSDSIKREGTEAGMDSIASAHNLSLSGSMNGGRTATTPPSPATGHSTQSEDNLDSATSHRIQNLEKFQKAIKSAVNHWDDGHQEKTSPLEKLQSHLQSHSEDENWD